MRKKSLFFILLSLVILSLCGCRAQNAAESAPEASPGASPAAAEKSTVKVALIGKYEDAGSLEDQVALANIQDWPYYYEAESYKASDINSLLVKIGAGSGPDLIVFQGGLNTKSDQFEDLYPYLDKDPELSRDAFLPHLLSALETDGKLHELWTGVQIQTLAARRSDVGDGKGLTTADYDRILRENSQYQAIFETFMTGSNLLIWIADISSGEYIDWGSGTCHFTDQSFSDLLEWCRHMAPEFSGEMAPMSYDISEVILSVEPLTSLFRLKGIRNNFGEPYVFVGFPSENGQGNFYALGETDFSMAIPAGSRNKDGAWAFIRNALTAENQIDRSLRIGPFPVNAEAFQLWEKQAIKEADIKEDEINAFHDLLDNTTKAITYRGEQLRDIILDCGQAFIHGDKPLKETVSEIQSRVGVYVAETTG